MKRDIITLDEAALHDFCIQFMNENNFAELKSSCKPNLNGEENWISVHPSAMLRIIHRFSSLIPDSTKYPNLYKSTIRLNRALDKARYDCEHGNNVVLTDKDI